MELIKALRYKLRIFGVPIEGPTNLFFENEAVYKNVSTLEYTLRNKKYIIVYHYCREVVAGGKC